MAYRFTHFLDIMLIFSNKEVSVTILHFAICTYMVNLACLRTEDVFEEKKRVNEIYLWSWGFIFRIKVND